MREARIEPIFAWRMWRLRLDAETGLSLPELESCIYGDPWAELVAFKAECDRGHAAPHAECDCGIYATVTLEDALEQARWGQSAVPNLVVIGPVHLWGRVRPHVQGYRAEYAYPVGLELLARPDWQPRLEQDLRRAYLVAA
jgi:hypothetical protein